MKKYLKTQIPKIHFKILFNNIVEKDVLDFAKNVLLCYVTKILSLQINKLTVLPRIRYRLKIVTQHFVLLTKNTSALMLT